MPGFLSSFFPFKFIFHFLIQGIFHDRPRIYVNSQLSHSNFFNIKLMNKTKIDVLLYNTKKKLN